MCATGFEICKPLREIIRSWISSIWEATSGGRLDWMGMAETWGVGVMVCPGLVSLLDVGVAVFFSVAISIRVGYHFWAGVMIERTGHVSVRFESKKINLRC